MSPASCPGDEPQWASSPRSRRSRWARRAPRRASPCRRTRLGRSARAGSDHGRAWRCPSSLQGTPTATGGRRARAAAHCPDGRPPRRLEPTRLPSPARSPRRNGAGHRQAGAAHARCRASPRRRPRGRRRHGWRPAPRRRPPGSGPGVRSGTGTSSGTPAPSALAPPSWFAPSDPSGRSLGIPTGPDAHRRLRPPMGGGRRQRRRSVWVGHLTAADFGDLSAIDRPFGLGAQALTGPRPASASASSASNWPVTITFQVR